MTEWRDHTFVVLAYGDSPFLKGCLTALALQSVKSRIIVSTSTPSDFIAAAARDAGAELHINPQRQGIGADWNFGLKAAGTRYVTLAHQDDVYFPDFLQKTKALFDVYPDGAIAFTGFRQIGDRGEPKGSVLSAVKHLLSAVLLNGRKRVTGLSRRLFLSFGNPLTCSAVTYNLENLPGFSFRTDLASNLDWEAWWRLHLEDKTLLHAPEQLLGRRHNDLTETSKLIASGKRQTEDAMMFSAIWPRPVASVLHALYAASYGAGGGRIMRFAIVGTALTLLGYLIYAIGLLVGLHYLVAATLGWAAGVVFSYFANKSFTFSLGRKFVWTEFLLLAAGYLLQLGIGLLGLFVLIDGLGLGETISWWINLVFTATFSFLYMQYGVFRTR